MNNPAKDIKHRKAIKRFFITFPQSDNLGRDLFFEDIHNTFPSTKAICARELHKDGNPHLHLAIELVDSITKHQLLQHLIFLYPFDYKRINVQAMRSMSNSITYLTSPDKDKHVDLSPFLYNITIEDEDKKHEIFMREFKDEPECLRAQYCDEAHEHGCKKCQLFLDNLQKKSLLNFKISEKEEEDRMIANFFAE